VVIITVKAPREIKRKLERRRVNVSKTLLERYVADLDLKDLAAGLDALKQRLGEGIDGEWVARFVREHREAR
jgi:hypothetical protein